MDRRVFLRGLINTCPFTDTVKNCSIEQLRRLPLKDLVKRLKSLPDYEVISITKYHVKCKKARERITEPEVGVYDKFPI